MLLFTIFLIALIVSLLMVWLARALALRWQLVDKPGGHHAHEQPVALLGGVAVFLTSGFLYLVTSAEPGILIYTLFASAWVVIWGLWDDLRPLPSGSKLLIQIIAAIALISTGTQVLLPIPDVFNLVLTLLWIVGITNAINLMDNMDGLAAGVVAIAMVFFIVMALANGQWQLAFLAASVLGAVLGFLWFNFAPASIYLGDAGSLYLGLMAASLSLQLSFPLNSPQATWLVPIVLLGLPLFDTTLVIVSRLRRGLNPLTTPGHDHISHRIRAMGFTVCQTVLLLYIIAIVLGFLALWVSQQTPLVNAWLAVFFVLLSLLVIAWLEKS